MTSGDLVISQLVSAEEPKVLLGRTKNMAIRREKAPELVNIIPLFMVQFVKNHKHQQ